MSKHTISLLLLVFLVAPSWSQEDAPDEEQAAPPVVAEEAAAEDVAAEEDVDDVDDADLDLQTYEEDDDDFVPSEEIPADVPIPFPSNI